MAILGGAAFWDGDEADAGRGLALAVERGVNHLDIAPQYGGAEEAVGPHLPAVRDRVFVACKTLRANADGVRDQLDTSLQRLRTDHVDLYQMHAVTTVEELDRRAAAIEVIFAARDAGLCRWVGITGHDLTAPATFLEALRRYDLDTVMFPVYPRLWADDDYRAAATELLAVCAQRDVGVMAIKAAARRRWEGEAPASPWYEPWPAGPELERGIRFALSTQGVHAFCTPGDLGLLPDVLDVAEGVTPMSAGERADAIAAVAADEPIFPMRA
ncbi:MAG: aldo/keto reductase [Acidimicrobiales bacterium]|nr:aldo/keto reductase [Acidimicrobiales bacterium]